MIVTVTVNAAIDRTLSVPNFRLGQRHRAVEARTLAGGKGVNVARALKLLGQPVIATGFAGGMTGERIVTELDGEDVFNDFVRIADESRASTAVVDPMSNEQTEINEYGPQVSGAEAEQFTKKLQYLAKGASIIVFAGSLPRDMEETAYAEMIKAIKGTGVLTVVDCEGAPLRAALREGPSVVMPNLLEAEDLVGHEFNEDADFHHAVKEICSMGAGSAMVKLPEGCYAQVGKKSEREFFKATLEPLDPVSKVGSGDAFLAGYVAKAYEGKSQADAIRYAVACGAESTQHFGAGIIDRREVERLVPEVELTEAGSTEKVPAS